MEVTIESIPIEDTFQQGEAPKDVMQCFYFRRFWSTKLHCQSLVLKRPIWGPISHSNQALTLFLGGPKPPLLLGMNIVLRMLSAINDCTQHSSGMLNFPTLQFKRLNIPSYH